ncbi:hypothetical protein [Aquibacillus sediminis]|uniref:hypothetical protein n=1 Tax=Aquibacillus sediminis TaxID=2574734 RepID=UPI001486CF82|nr:hypothetical protein [Aquibacillus sediminis]
MSLFLREKLELSAIDELNFTERKKQVQETRHKIRMPKDNYLKVTADKNSNVYERYQVAKVHKKNEDNSASARILRSKQL